MKKLIIIILILIPFTASAQLWGKAESKDVNDILIIEGDIKGVFVITRKADLVFVLNTEQSKLIVQYADSKIPIRTMTYKNIKDAIKIIEQVFPKYKCLNNYGLKKCELKEKFQIEEE